jgi:hypothetical protein
MVKYAVAIEERRRPASARWNFAAGLREIIMDTDVNKIALTSSSK